MPPWSTVTRQNHVWSRQYQFDRLSAKDDQATLIALTADTLADATRTSDIEIDRVLICGGGAHNSCRLELLQSLLGDTPVESTEFNGIHSDRIEAMAFAWLAQCHIEGKPGNPPSVTSARKAVVLGTLSAPDI